MIGEAEDFERFFGFSVFFVIFSILLIFPFCLCFWLMAPEEPPTYPQQFNYSEFVQFIMQANRQLNRNRNLN
jgi:hypothetical protein